MDGWLWVNSDVIPSDYNLDNGCLHFAAIGM
jgi:hypothetical protein